MELDQKDQDIIRLFNALPALTPSRELFMSIFISYELHRRSMARLRLSMISVIALFSLGSLVPAIMFSISEFSKSGFGSYFSLIFSDTQHLIPYTKEFGLTLVESAPVLAVSLTLFGLFVFLASIKIAGKNYKTAFMPVGTVA